MEIRYLSDNDDRNQISRIYVESWRYAYQGVIPKDYTLMLSLKEIGLKFLTFPVGIPWSALKTAVLSGQAASANQDLSSTQIPVKSFQFISCPSTSERDMAGSCSIAYWTS